MRSRPTATTAGQAHNITAASALLEALQADAVLTDKAYDSNDLRDKIAGMEGAGGNPSKRNCKLFIPHDTQPLQATQPDRAMLRMAWT
ncbi:hypothetical protein [Sphingomonas sp.]|uniref:hypothetical protein n=1 Tax=Sphingomonas sp. TaxID=28214 RepID=UPI00257BA4FB|nr:hypothetical protein [Sphingomonas sp.]